MQYGISVLHSTEIKAFKLNITYVYFLNTKKTILGLVCPAAAVVVTAVQI